MTTKNDLTALDISVGRDDTQDGIHLGVDGEPFWRVEITPQGLVKMGNGVAPPTNLSAAQGGAAGGDLTGNYPNPSIGPGTITDAKVAVGAAIARTKIAAPEAFHVIGATGEPAFAAGWASFTTGGYRPVGFALDPLTGIVQLSGIAQATTDPPAAATIFTLPSDYIPTYRQALGCRVTGGNSYIVIYQSSGVVQITIDLAVNQIVYLDDLSYRLN